MQNRLGARIEVVVREDPCISKLRLRPVQGDAAARRDLWRWGCSRLIAQAQGTFARIKVKMPPTSTPEPSPCWASVGNLRQPRQLAARSRGTWLASHLTALDLPVQMCLPT